MKHTAFYLLVFLLGVCLFSSAKQQNTTCDRRCPQQTVIEKKSMESKTSKKTLGAGFGLSPLNFFLSDF